MPCRQCGANLPDNASFCHVCGTSDPITIVIPTKDPLLGRVLNRQYRINRKLGEGGFGSVYEAYEPRFERKVAIKTIHAKLAEDHTILERFRREGMTASKLEHPAAVKVFNLGETEDGLVFMVMEFLDGDTLASYLNQHGALSAKETITLLTPIFEVLAEAHQKGIIHRDLKPQNIMLSPKQSGGYAPKLLDFGISKIISAKSITQTAASMGTPAYMAPEQWEEGKSVGPTADLYAMGLIVYQCVTGVLPFEAETAPGWMKNHCLEQPRDLHKIAPALPVAFCNVVMRALSKKPADRFQDASSFLQALTQTRPEGDATPIATVGLASPDAPTVAQVPPKPAPGSSQNTLPGVSTSKKNFLFVSLSVAGIALLIGLFYLLAEETATPQLEQPPQKTITETTKPAPTSAKAMSWQWSNPRPQGNTLHRFFKLNDKELYIVGDVGTILRSQDGGSTWKVAATKTYANLKSFWITQAGKGFSVGDKGTILRTIDRGETWSLCTSPISEPIIGVWNNNEAVVILSETRALRSSIDCAHWGSVTLELPATLSSGTAVFRSLYSVKDTSKKPETGKDPPELMFVVGDEAMLYRSSDFGFTWERLILPTFPGEGAYVGIIEMTQDESGALYLLRNAADTLMSKDLGLTWTTRITQANGYTPVGIALGKDGQFVAAATDDIWLQTGGVWKSFFEVKEPYAELHDFYGDSRGFWAVGSAGRLAFSPDGFSSWENRPAVPSFDAMRSVRGSSRKNLFAVGGGGTILHSTNGGESWSKEEAFRKDDNTVISDQVEDVWVEGDEAYGIARNLFLTRTEKGWGGVTTPEVLHCMWKSGNKFYLGGYDATILSSKDKGATWETETSKNDGDMIVETFWQDENKELWAAGTKGLLMHSSGDSAWEEASISGGEKYNFLGLWGSGSTLVLVGVEVKREETQTLYGGPILFLSKDSGKTWAKQKNMFGDEALLGVWGSSPDDFYLTSASGVIYHTADGGKAWREDFLVGQPLGRIWGIDGELFVVGAGGTILHFF